MNRLLALSVPQFEKSIQHLKATDVQALQQLISREIQLEKDELLRVSSLLNRESMDDAERKRLTNSHKDSDDRLQGLLTKMEVCQMQFSNESPQSANKTVPVVQDFRNHRSAYSSKSSIQLSSSPTPKIPIPVQTFTTKQSASPQILRRTAPKSPELSRNSVSSNGNAPNRFSSIESPTLSRRQPIRTSQSAIDIVAENQSGVEEDSIDARSAIATFERLSSISCDQTNGEPRRSLFVKRLSVTKSVHSYESDNSSAPNSSSNTPRSDYEVRRSVGSLELQKPKRDIEVVLADKPIDKSVFSAVSNGKLAVKLVEQQANTQASVPDRKLPANGTEYILRSTRKPVDGVDSGSILRSKSSIEVNEYSASENHGVSLVSKSQSVNGVNASSNDDRIKPPISLKNWDPILLLNKLYEIQQSSDSDAVSQHGTPVEGFLEQLPYQTTKATILKTWKRRYFRAENGQLKVFDDEHSTEPLQIIELSGGFVEPLGEYAFGIDDGRGLFTTVRCTNDTDLNRWILALTTHTAERENLKHLKMPVPSNGFRFEKNVVIIDIGTFSIRAGLLKDKPELPDLYFPNVASMTKKGQVYEVGSQAFQINHRSYCEVVRPFKPEGTLENFAFDSGIIKMTFEKIFEELKINHRTHTVFLVLPPNVSDAVRSQLAEVLLRQLNCAAVSMCGQALLALHAYGEPTGIMVNMGSRVEILPITDGIVQLGGLTRQIYGGNLLLQSFNQLLAEQKYRFNSPTELLLTRYAMEQTAFVAQERTRPLINETIEIDLSPYDMPSDFTQKLRLTADRSQPAEGFFDPELFGLDSPSLARLVQKAVQACPMDFRRTLCRSIFLAGGASLIPGLASRLEHEVSRLVPTSCTVRVHAAPNRHHFPFLGASYVAHSAGFPSTCVTLKEWTNAVEGGGRQLALSRWHI